MVEFNSMAIDSATPIKSLPDRDRFSIVMAVILLAFSLTQFIEIPVWEPAWQLPWIYISFQISIQNVNLAIVAGLTASGADWLFHDHPVLEKRQTSPHWLLLMIIR